MTCVLAYRIIECSVLKICFLGSRRGPQMVQRSLVLLHDDEESGSIDEEPVPESEVLYQSGLDDAWVDGYT